MTANMPGASTTVNRILIGRAADYDTARASDPRQLVTHRPSIGLRALLSVALWDDRDDIRGHLATYVGSGCTPFLFLTSQVPVRRP